MAFITVLILWSAIQIVSISGFHSFSRGLVHSDLSTCSHSESPSSLVAKSLPDDYEAAPSLSNPTAENSCSKSYSLPFNTEIGLQAVSSEECTININAPLDSPSSFVIKIKRREGNPYYSTFFVENLLEQENTADIISFPQSGCAIQVAGKSLKFHLIMTYVEIDIHNLGNTTKMQKQNNCSIEYNGAEWLHHKWYYVSPTYSFKSSIRIWVNKYNLFCPKGCICSLGHNQWQTHCKAKEYRVLLVCNPNILSLAFLKRRLNKVQPESFLCFVSLRRLILSKNYVHTLPKQIFEVLKQLTFLDLSSNQLLSLPDGIFDHQLKLETLKLNHNYLAFLPVDVFRNLAKLEYLELSHNAFHSIAVNIIFNIPTDKDLYYTTYLKWEFNKLSVIEINAFNLAINLTRLILNNNELSILRPGVFRKLESLLFLDLSYNLLSSLAEDVLIGLTRLLKIDVSGNYFIELPNITLPMLSNLYIGRNKVSSIEPTYFKEFVKIGTLNLSHNKISIFPLGIFANLLEIFQLNLANNDITHLMRQSLHLTIARLNLRNNRLFSLPHDIFDGFRNLDELILENNRLIELPDLSSATKLRYLYLSNNRLTILDANSLRALRKIRWLFLQDNSFVHFQEESFQFQTMIRLLDISRNKLEFLQTDLLSKCTKLLILLAGYNRIYQLALGIFDSLTNVVKLSLEYNNLSMLNKTLFLQMQSLLFLYLDGNNLLTLHPNIFTSNTELRYLVLSWNTRMVIFPETIESLTRLQVLDLEDINLKNISYGFFDSFVNLQTLLMSNNHITYLHESMYNMTTKLLLLDLCCNSIRFLPMSIFTPLVSLDYLNLAYNLLHELPSLASCRKLVFLVLSNNMLSNSSLYGLRRLSNLKMLKMQNNNITVIPRNGFQSLKLLRAFLLHSNLITHLDAGLFKSLTNLQILSMSNNFISNIDGDSFVGLRNLITLELQYNKLAYIVQGTFEILTNLIFLNISQNNIQHVYLGAIKSSVLQMTFDLRGNPLMLLTPHSFPKIEIKFLVDHYSACCFMGGNVTCVSLNVRSDYLTCKRMLPSIMLRLTMWLIGLAAVIFNFSVICSRLFLGMKNTLQSVLVLNLAISDFLMGIDMLILSSTDFYYHDFFPSYSAGWIKSSMCKIAAALSTLSSEASVILMALIGFDRYLGVRYPLSVHRGLGKTRTRICVMMCWLISLIISLIPVVFDKYAPIFYDISEVCVGLPIVKRKVTVEKGTFIPVQAFAIEPEIIYGLNSSWDPSFHHNIGGGHWHLAGTNTIQEIYYRFSEVSGFKLASILSIVVFIGFNLTCFAALVVFYTRIFQIARESNTAIKSTKQNQEIRMALKISIVVMTDFLCWVPLALVCLFVQCGMLTVGPGFYSWTVGLILPINSCLNPFLYTLAVALVNRSK